jgi:hypothetical protein
MEEHAMLHHRLPIVLLASFAAVASAASELPTRKAGLWEIKSSADDGNSPPQVIQQCVDAATDKQMNETFGTSAGAKCSKNDIKKSGSTIIADSICKFGATTSTTRAVYSGDFNSAFTVKVSTTMEGSTAKTAPGRAGPNDSTIEAKWLGACKPGQKPGDVVTTEGAKMNIFDLQKGAPPPR